MENQLNTTEYLGPRIAAFRHAKGWTQEYLAGELDVSDRSIRAWEGGETVPTIANLIRIANKLGIEIGRLFK